MSAFELTSRAEADLQEIWHFIAQDNPSAADQLESRFFGAFVRLSDQPTLGHRREDLTDLDCLFFAVQKYLIIYDPTETPLAILRVAHSARNIPELLAPED